ncbi:MAG: hypothetical protein JWP07_776 [Pseudonocardiales bacterium]|nr:hypothetical protein [Pseudonocardiales bacterium]
MGHSAATPVPHLPDEFTGGGLYGVDIIVQTMEQTDHNLPKGDVGSASRQTGPMGAQALRAGRGVPNSGAGAVAPATAQAAAMDAPRLAVACEPVGAVGAERAGSA